MQLVQLQQIFPRLEAAGYRLLGISYDRVPKLAAFAEEHGITFPLLADFGSTWMRRLGLVNERVAEDHARYGIAPRPNHEGLPHPGVLVLDARGVVQETVFYDNYRERPTGTTLLDEVLGVATEPVTVEPATTAGPIRIEASIDQTEWAWFQRSRMKLRISIDSGWHVYIDPVPDGYHPLQVTVDGPEGLQVGDVEGPTGHEHRIAGLDEVFQVVDDQIEVAVPLLFSMARGSGAATVRAHVDYQACDDRTCLPPSRATVEFVVEERPAP